MNGISFSIKAIVLGVSLTFSTQSALAASHSDAPLIKQDPQANITDVYAFVGTKYDDPAEKVLNVVVHVRPFSEPGDGVIYDRFADDAQYSIHITDPASGASVRRYDFVFSDINPLIPPGLKNPDTIISYGLGTEVGSILNVGDNRQNYTQTYKVTKVEASGSEIIGNDMLTPPPNVGARTTPAYNDAVTGKALSGASNFAELDKYTQQTIYDLNTGEVVFAGPREDGFYADTPAIFDLLGIRDPGVDGFKGFNVLAYGIQIPLDTLPSFPYNAPFFGPKTGVGVYASVSRQSIHVLRTTGDPISSGALIQVNRMGNPLFNETLVAPKDKDNYNRTSPTLDAMRFATYAENPELASLLNAVLGVSLVATGRTDLRDIFIPDVLRVDTATDPVSLAGQTGFNRLGFIGGDTTTGSTNSSGWPNGRRFGDDVVDIALTAIVSGPTYTTITQVGDNVNANDQIYHQVFPYSATPHAGPTAVLRSPLP